MERKMTDQPENDGPYQDAQSAEELERYVMGSTFPKTRAEWWARGEIDRLRARIAELEAALKPLEKAWLFPDDLGEEASAIIRSEPDWNEEENDRAREDVIVCRQEIRKARAALRKES